MLLGGQLRRVDGGVAGALALENLQRFTFSVAFIGVSGFSEVGISVGSLGGGGAQGGRRSSAPAAWCSRSTTRRSARTDFARIAGLDAVDVVVMDQTTPAVEELCASFDIELIAADAAQ